MKNNEKLLWGDEVGSAEAFKDALPANNYQIEYIVVAFDDKHREVKLSLRQADILEALGRDEELVKQGGGVPEVNEGTKEYVVRRSIDPNPTS